MNARTDPTLVTAPGATPLRGSDLQMFGATLGGPILKNRLFSFTSFEQWDDNRPLSIVRTVPTELERRGDFSQSQLNGRVRTIYNPFTSTLDRRRTRRPQPFAGNVIPSRSSIRWRVQDARGHSRCRTCPATSTTGRAASTRR